MFSPLRLICRADIYSSSEMSKEQKDTPQDRGELISPCARIRTSGDMAMQMMVNLPYSYLFFANPGKNSEVEGFLNKIDSKTNLQHRILAARMLETFFDENSREDIKAVYVKGDGTNFSKIGFEEGNPVILLDLNHEGSKISIIDNVFGTDKLRFTPAILCNIFETLVAVQKHKEGQKVE